MSCYEIHIETVRDLFQPTNTLANVMTQQSKWKPTEFQVKDVASVDMLIKRAQENRSTAKTELNAQSSRSHCIYQLSVQGSDAKLNLVDLAGSEKINQSKVEGSHR